MSLRFITILLCSGAAHAAVFVMGPGQLPRLHTGLGNAGALTVSVTVVNLRSSDVNDRDQSESGSTPDRPGSTPAGGPSPATRMPPADHQSSPKSRRNTRPLPTAGLRTLNPSVPRPEPVAAPGPVFERSEATGADVSRQGSLNRRAAEASAALREEARVSRQTVEDRYLAEFLAALSRHKHYPRAARAGGRQGRVVVGLKLNKDGTIADLRIEEPSPFAVLNRAALESVTRLERFKPFPDQLDRTEWRLNVPFQYAMGER